MVLRNTDCETKTKFKGDFYDRHNRVMNKLTSLIKRGDIGITDHAMGAIQCRFNGDIMYVLRTLQKNIHTLAWNERTKCYSICTLEEYFILKDNQIITCVKKDGQKPTYN